MKKLLTFAGTAIAAVLLVAGCSSSTPDATSGTKAEATQSAAAAAPEEIVIYVARHGKTMLNTVDRSQGWIDAPLTPAGVEVAEALGKGLSDVSFDAAYSSDSGRAVETAQLVLENNGQAELFKTLTTDPRLREFNFGTYEGMLNEEMWTAIAKAQGMTMEEFQGAMATDGFVKSIKGFADTLAELDAKNGEAGINWPAEDYQTVVDRATAGLDAIVADAEANNYGTVLLVSHGMTIATLAATLDPSAEIPPTGLSNASITKITYKDGKYTVETVNDMSYVEAGQSM